MFQMLKETKLQISFIWIEFANSNNRNIVANPLNLMFIFGFKNCEDWGKNKLALVYFIF